MNPRIYLLALGTFALGTDLFVIAGVLPAIAHEQAVSVDMAGLLITVFSLMYGFCAPVLAAFTNRMPRQGLLMIVLVGFSVANVFSALAPTFPLTATTQIGVSMALAIWGMCGNVLFAPQQHRLLSLSPTLPTIMLALNSAVLYLGIAAGSAIGSVVLIHGFVGALAMASAVFTVVALVIFACSVWVSSHRTSQKIADQVLIDNRMSSDSRAN